MPLGMVYQTYLTTDVVVVTAMVAVIFILSTGSKRLIIIIAVYWKQTSCIHNSRVARAAFPYEVRTKYFTKVAVAFLKW